MPDAVRWRFVPTESSASILHEGGGLPVRRSLACKASTPSHSPFLLFSAPETDVVSAQPPQGTCQQLLQAGVSIRLVIAACFFESEIPGTQAVQLLSKRHKGWLFLCACGVRVSVPVRYRVSAGSVSSLPLRQIRSWLRLHPHFGVFYSKVRGRRASRNYGPK